MTTKSRAHDTARAEDATIEERLAEARRQSLDASRVAYEAKGALERLELEAATARARAKLEAALAQGALSPELHGELVCDAAREHGATCARAQSISEVSWRAVRVAVASIVERLAEVTRERDELRDRVAIAEEERDEARQQRDEVTRERDQAQAAERTFALRLRLVHEALGDPECEVVLTSDLVTRRLHEAQEQGARWALLSSEMRLGPALVPQQAARICAKARAKGGE